MDALQRTVIELARDGLGDPQATIDTEYAISLLPEPYRSGLESDRQELEHFYLLRMGVVPGWDEAASPEMLGLKAGVDVWLRELSPRAAKGLTDRQMAVQVVESGKHLRNYLALSADERTWFIDVRETYRWRFMSRRGQKFIQQLQPVYVVMDQADRLEPYDQKLRSVAREWLNEALMRGGS